MTAEFKNLSAIEIIKGLNHKEYSSLEVVQYHIDQIEKLNPTLNAIVVERFEQAIDEAKVADEKRSKLTKDDIPPILGMPITIKEMYDLKGLPTTGGVYKYKDEMATEDAEVVKRVKDAGAIILGKTNMSTLTLAHETDNVLFGRTNHWLDQTRTSGGSSGGEGVIIAAGGSPWGVGSDSGGSIRLPSHFNGITGIRPTYDRIPTKGEFPHFNNQGNINSAGPLAKTTEDVKVLYQILSQHKLEETNIKDIPLFWLPEVSSAPLNQEIAKGISNLIGNIESDNKKIQQVDGAFMKDVVDIWQTIMIQDGGEEIQNFIQEGESFNRFIEFIKSFSKKGHYHKWIIWTLAGARILNPSRKKIAKMMEALEQLRLSFSKTIQENGILILPVFPIIAPKHGTIVKKVNTGFGAKLVPYLILANTLGYPAMSVPIGKTQEGLPFGVQVLGNYHQEARVFEVAKLIEQTAGFKIR